MTGPYARIGGVEAARRYEHGRRYLFLLNHGDREVAAEMTGTELTGGSGAEPVLRATVLRPAR